MEDKGEKRSFDHMEQSDSHSHAEEYVYSATDHLTLEKRCTRRPRFSEKHRHHCDIDISSKIAALKASPSVVSLVSFSGEELISECSGTIIEVEQNNNVVVTSLNLIRQPTDADVFENSLADNLKIIIRSYDECSYIGEVWAYDFHYNILFVKFKSSVSLQPANLRMIDNATGLDESFQLRPHTFKVKVGVPVVVVGRYFYRSFDLMAASGCFCISPISWPLMFECRELLSTSCSITICGDGGPLINLAGEVIGIAFFENSPTPPFLPINIAYKLWNHYKRFKELRHPSYGFKASNLFEAGLLTLERLWKRFPSISNGLLVKKVRPGSYAESSGLLEDDIILKFDGKEVKSFLELWDLMWDKVGEFSEMEVFRADHSTILNISMMVGEACPNELNNWPRFDWMKKSWAASIY